MIALYVPLGFGIGSGRYYGWRVYIHVGPILLAIGRCVPRGFKRK